MTEPPPSGLTHRRSTPKVLAPFCALLPIHDLVQLSLVLLQVLHPALLQHLFALSRFEEERFLAVRLLLAFGFLPSRHGRLFALLLFDGCLFALQSRQFLHHRFAFDLVYGTTLLLGRFESCPDAIDFVLSRLIDEAVRGLEGFGIIRTD